MRPFRLPTRRAEIDLSQRDAVLRAARVAAGFRGFSLRDRHERLPTIASGASTERQLARRGDHLEEAAVVRDHDKRPVVADKRELELLDGLEVEVVGGLVE